jgi:DNA polymerase-3 subunit alpha
MTSTFVQPFVQPFVHLRLHSEYSLSDGMVRIKPLAAACAEMQMPAVAMTDINNVFGLIKFYNAANSRGIKPLVAADVSVPASMPGLEPTPLVLIAANEAGYRNLSELLSRGYLEGQKLGKVGIEQAWLAEQPEGLIALSGGRFGDVGQLLLAGKYELARAAAERWMAIYPDRYYLELTSLVRLWRPTMFGFLIRKNSKPMRCESVFMTAIPWTIRAERNAIAKNST